MRICGRCRYIAAVFDRRGGTVYAYCRKYSILNAKGEKLMRRRYIVRYAIVIFIAIVALLLTTSFVMNDDAQQAVNIEKWCEYTIEPGDTLWTITRSMYDDSCDIRYKIAEICEKNGICADKITAGDVILLPVREE